jgi:hypothetical protein
LKLYAVWCGPQISQQYSIKTRDGTDVCIIQYT